MLLLIITSLIWAFSFGLIKGGLEGIASPVIALIRLGVAFAVFLPFFRPQKLPFPIVIRLLATGAIQYGLMYLFYIEAFRYLKAYEIALFTVFTPFFVTIINDLSEKKINKVALLSGLLAVVGGIIIQYSQLTSAELQKGFVLMQVSNLCFAFGQIYYRQVMSEAPPEKSDLQMFSLLYLGATLAVIPVAAHQCTTAIITARQFLILFYLGAIASGLGFFLWNSGARSVNPGTLAVFNNLKIPLGIIVSIVFFGESTNLPRLFAGGAMILLALLLNERSALPLGLMRTQTPIKKTI
ncbi:MAG: EamA family transporter [Erysipelotrichia bacterium]|nr:EamA family transporter [Erysipelotrichia bacterium]